MNDRPFSLQPRPSLDRGPQNVSEFIRRVNADPGGFRGLDSADLRRQIDARHNDPDREDDDVDMAGAASEADSDATETKDVVAARDDILRAIHMTHQTSMFALDFISLLLSKENPAQAVTTFSHGLREMVGVGTLGATMLQTPTPLTLSRVPDNKMVAIGKRLVDLNKAADTALVASKRLQQEIGSETKYWSEVLSVSQEGWRTFRLPHEPHTMGVKFGFSNTAPEFKANGIAPMRRAEDGSVRLEHGKMGGGSKRIQVSILENGLVVGRSSLPPPLAADAPLQDRVKESRDTIFAQELWHEINREGRTVLSRHVRLDKSAVSCALDDTRTISFRLATLGEADDAGPEPAGPQDAIAEALYLMLCLLLSAAHRTNELRRSEPSANRGPPPPYSLLTPIVSYYEFDKNIQQFVQFITAFANVLRSAGLPASIAMKEPPLTAPPGETASLALAAILLRPPVVQFDLTITPESRLRILLKPSPQYGAQFTVHCLPPSQPGSQNPLASLCSPAGDEFDRIKELCWYLCRAVPRALTAHYHKTVAAPAVNGQSPPAPPSWAVHTSNAGLVDYKTREHKIHFDFSPSPDTADRRPALRVKADFLDAGKKVHSEWTWHGLQGEANLDEIVRHVLSTVGA
ncbi:RNA polymerase II mediator complex subunit [Madurella fahalii]|uniref:Mediator of RNA polymerase II transcription subunit 17 n=1 Tax=Madurella fahalii TaxID=1157608 RepID=A0ABQ0G1M1_9PEZI